MARDNVDTPRGVFHGLGEEYDGGVEGAEIDYAGLDKAELAARVLDKTKKLHNLVTKMSAEHRMQIFDHDREIIEEFENDPFLFIDNDAYLAIRLKKLYDKRKAEIKRRAQMGVNNIARITD